MPGFREFLRSPQGKYAGAGILTVAIAALAWSAYSNLHDSNVSSANNANFVDAESGKSFNHTIQIGDRVPVKSPFSGKNTGYPAELCFWTKDGKLKKDPTPVLLNSYANKPGATFCPDCGRLVVAHNPPPMPNSTPPPTKEQYESRNANSKD